MTRILCGSIRALLPREQLLNVCQRNKYHWVVEQNYEYHDEFNGIHITVPKGFLTDGSTGGPDYGSSWLFHDYLYSTHSFDNGVYCRREDADQIMLKILERENLYTQVCVYSLALCMYRTAVSIVTTYNPFWLLSRAWDQSGTRGPQFLQNYINEENK